MEYIPDPIIITQSICNTDMFIVCRIFNIGEWIMKLLDDYLDLQTQIFDYFGYVENWRAIPLEDRREYYWILEGEGPGHVRYAETKEQLNDIDAGNYYEDSIYTQRFLEKWVYRKEGYTLICVDTHTDLNKFLAIFDNEKELKS
jgi:hypothetical protein